MSIRSLARELYKAQQKVAELQKRIDSAAQDEKDFLAQDMNLAQKELQMLRRMLDGEKESGPFRQRFSGFGNGKK
jgi:hypothetical protein